MDSEQAFAPAASPGVTASGTIGLGEVLLLLALLGCLLLAFYQLVAYTLHYFDAVTRAAKRPPAIPLYLAAILGEWWFSFACALSTPLGWLPVRSRPGPSTGVPILLVHGYAVNRACFFALYWRLQRYGSPHVVTFNLPTLRWSIEEMAEIVSGRIRELSQQHAGERVQVIAHSLGGLVVRCCLYQDPELPIAKLITLGTPHQGTRLAYLARGPAAVQLRPGSAFLKKIDKPLPVPFVSIYSALDSHVLPTESAARGDSIVRFADLGHLSLLYSGRVFAAVVRELGWEAPGGAPAASRVHSGEESRLS